MPESFNLSFEPLLALGVLALVGMLCNVGLLLRLVLLGVLRLHVTFQLNLLHGTPPNVLFQTDFAFVGIIPQMNLLDMLPEITFAGESAVTGEGVLLKVAWRRGPGAGVASAEVDSLAVFLHVAGPREALSTIRALVRARHLMDSLGMQCEVAFLTEGFAAGWTLEVLDLGMYGPHVTHHIFGRKKNLGTNPAFIALLSGRLPVAVRETEGSLVIHEYFAIVEDILTTFANQLPVVLGKFEAGFLKAGVLVDEETQIAAEIRKTTFALPAFFPVIFLALKSIPYLDIDAKLLGVLLAVEYQKLSAVDDVLGDAVVDLAMELEPDHVLGVAVVGAVYLC